MTFFISYNLYRPTHPFSLLTGLLLLGATLFPAYGQHTWKSHPTATAEDLHGITYGAGTFVAVGDKGIILTSPNGTNWKNQHSGTTNDLYKVTYGKGQFVAVGENTILTSNDGLHWVLRQPPVHYMHLRGISYSGEKYVATAGFAGILTSSDGIDWQALLSTQATYLTGVGYGKNQFVAVGSQGAINTASPLGSSWAKKRLSLPSSPTPAEQATDFSDVHYGGGRFIAVGAKTILTSGDGTNWTKTEQHEPLYLYGVSYGGKQFVAVGYDGVVQTSPDGSVWTSQISNTQQVLYGVSSSETKFVAVGAQGTIISYDINSASAQQTEEVAQQPGHSQVKPDQPTGLLTTETTLTQPELIALTPNAESQDQLLAYPNPSDNGRFRLVVPKDTRRLRIMTVQGQSILELADPSTVSEVDLSQFVSGIYWLRVETPDRARVFKLVKR